MVFNTRTHSVVTFISGILVMYQNIRNIRTINSFVFEFLFSYYQYISNLVFTLTHISHIISGPYPPTCFLYNLLSHYYLSQSQALSSSCLLSFLSLLSIHPAASILFNPRNPSLWHSCPILFICSFYYQSKHSHQTYNSANYELQSFKTQNYRLIVSVILDFQWRHSLVIPV